MPTAANQQRKWAAEGMIEQLPNGALEPVPAALTVHERERQLAEAVW
jgi:hypothetical protein